MLPKNLRFDLYFRTTYVTKLAMDLEEIGYESVNYIQLAEATVDCGLLPTL